MKGICTHLLLSFALLTGTSSSALAFDLFGLFSSDRDNALETMLESVPADTVLFMGGHTRSDAAAFFDEYMMGTSESDVQALNDILLAQDSTPGMRIVGWLMADYMASASEGYQALYNRYGLAEDGAVLFYLHGAIPVARFAVADEEALWTLLDRAAAETGAQHRDLTIDEARVRRWTLTPDDAKSQFDLAATVSDGVAALSLVSDQDTSDQQARRLGLAPVGDSLADAGAWEDLGERYGFDPHVRGYIDIAGLTESLLMPANTSLGRDLQRLAPEVTADLGSGLDDVCRGEIVDLARQAPRFVFGGERYDVGAEAMTQTVRMVWEMNNASVTSELQKLPGSLPAYGSDASDKLMALALGIDVNALAPVATALWTRFTSADFECQRLVDLQTQAQTVNPAMLGMVSGMAQGVKGVGAALYSLEQDNSSPVGVNGSVLVSISADNPQTVASLIASSVPGLSGLNIPSTGEAVQIPVPLPSMPVHAAIKGKHLVVYTGEPARVAADAMATEPLNSDGTTAFALNYQGFGDAMLTAIDANSGGAGNPLGGMASPTGDCTELYATFLQLSQVPATATYRDDYTERGWEGVMDVSIQARDASTRVQPGAYRTETLDYDCSWFSSGTEQLNGDGTGEYIETADGGQCDLYVNRYSWEQQGGRIIQTGVSERTRDTCEADWTEQAARTFECSVLGTGDNGFYCLYNFDGEPVLMRYRR